MMKNKENESIFTTTPEINPKQIGNVFSENDSIPSTDSSVATENIKEHENQDYSPTQVVSVEEKESTNIIEPNINNEELETKYEEVENKKNNEPHRMDSHFDGKLLDLIGWTFLRNILAILTLGITSS